MKNGFAAARKERAEIHLYRALGTSSSHRCGDGTSRHLLAETVLLPPASCPWASARDARSKSPAGNDPAAAHALLPSIGPSYGGDHAAAPATTLTQRTLHCRHKYGPAEPAHTENDHINSFSQQHKSLPAAQMKSAPQWIEQTSRTLIQQCGKQEIHTS